MGYEVEIATSITGEIDHRLIELDIKMYDLDFQRHPLNIDNLTTYKKLKKIIVEGNYDVIHTHTPVASTLARLVSKNLDIVTVYTAHGFHFYKGAPLVNWLVYYPTERYLSKHTDVLLTMNEEDFQIASSWKRPKTYKVSGVGVNLDRITNTEVNIDVKKEELGISKDSFVMTSVGELSKRKNHEVVIKALAKLKNVNVEYIICGPGPLKEYLENLAVTLNVENKVHFLGQRKDVTEINMISNLFILPSYQEGLPVALMEAMASGVPVLATDIRGSSDLISEKGGFLVDPDDIDGFARKINKAYKLGNEKLNEMGIYNKNKVKKYSIDRVIEEMRRIYMDINNHDH